MIRNKCRSHTEKEEAARRALSRRLASSGGFTMVELLLAMLLVAMLTGLVGGGVNVVQNAWKKVVIKADAQLALSMAVSVVSAELRAAEPSTIEVSSDGESVTFYNVDRGYKMTLNHTYTDGTGTKKDNLYIHAASSITHMMKLLTEESLPSGLVPRITGVSYDTSKHCFACTVSIVRVEDSAEAAYASQKIIVRPVNQ